MGVEVKKVETTYAETGVGQADRTDVTYELGAEIDGAWVRFASVTESTVEAAKAAAAAQAEADAAAQSTTEAPADTGTPPASSEASSSGGLTAPPPGSSA